MTNVFMRWWLMVLAFSVVLFWAAKAGAIHAVLVADVTHLTSLTAFFLVLATIVLGYASYNLRNDSQTKRILEFGWFANDVCMALGLLGTVIGCIILFNANLSAIDTSNQAATMGLLNHMSSALGTALSTTAVGVASSIMLKLQAFNLQHALDSAEDSFFE